jgi:hypothetical protein
MAATWKWGDAEAIIKNWAQTMSDRLAQLHSGAASSRLDRQGQACIPSFDGSKAQTARDIDAPKKRRRNNFRTRGP